MQAFQVIYTFSFPLNFDTLDGIIHERIYVKCYSSEVLRKRKMTAKELVKWNGISQMLPEESCVECEMVCQKITKYVSITLTSVQNTKLP
jgi:hypothetical protein